MSNNGPKRILVVDDDLEVVEVVKMVLGTKGYEIIPTFNGEDGYNALVSDQPDLMITDLRMPGMSGMELVKRARANADVAHIPILVISSLGATIDKPDSFWTLGLGSDDFLSKPFDPLGLLGRVEYLLRKGQYVSERGPEAQVAGRSTQPAPGLSAGQTSDDPAEVVRNFVDAWNKQDFALEYDSLGEEMLGGLSRTEYIGRRSSSFAEDAGQTRHQVIDAEAITVSNNVATVACLRDDEVRGTSKRKDERYTLKKTSQGWKIVNVRSRVMNDVVD